MHIDNKEKDNLIPGEGPTPGLDDKEAQNFFLLILILLILTIF